MSPANVDVIRDFYAATNEGDAGRSLSHWAEDIELVIPTGATLLAGTFKGREAALGWFVDWFTSFEDVRFDVTEVSEVDGGQVLLTADQHARGASSGLETQASVVWLYRLRNGKIARAEYFESRSAALEAVAQSK